MGGDPTSGIGGPVRASWRTRVANALYTDAKWQPDQCNYFLDQVGDERLAEQATKLRGLAAQYEAFHSGRMRLVAEGIRLAAEAIDPEAEGQW